MVQRKGLVDHLKCRTVPADVKKKMMKKSASIKRFEAESARSTKRVKEKPPPMSPMAKTPNYMKSTTSSDARIEQSRVSLKSPNSDCSNSRRKGSKKGLKNATLASGNSLKRTRTLTKNPSFKLVRASARKGSKVVLCENLELQKATCSSTLKDCKFPAYLSLNPGGTESEGTSSIKVCPYTYCSLNGHHHAASPPLMAFLSARRRLVKAQRRGRCVGNGLKLDEVFVMEDDVNIPRISPSSEEEQRDFIVEIFEQNRVVEMLLDAPVGDSAAEETEIDYETPGSDQECWPEAAVETDLDGEYGCCSDELMVDEASQRSWDEDSLCSISFPGSGDVEYATEVEALFGDLKSCQDEDVVIITTGDQMHPNQDETGEEIACYTETENMILDQSSIEGCHQVHIELPDDHQISNAEELAVTIPVNLAIEYTTQSRTGAGLITVDKGMDASKPEAEDSVLARNSANSKNPLEVSDKLALFNPRPPNFLPLEPDPDAEKVDLKHQELDERKNTEEWMVDYALRQVVAKLGPARKRKVSLLVEAFERVSPITKCELHMSHSPAFGLPSPIQACR